MRKTVKRHAPRVARVSGAAALLLAGCGVGLAKLRAAQGSLPPCTDGPHCVSSTSTDKDRYIAPLSYSGSRAQARERLLTVLKSMDGARIVQVQPDYIHATFTSAILRFVDDVEFQFPAGTQEIQVRSASRVGYYDFGVNRARVESIRKAFEGG